MFTVEIVGAIHRTHILDIYILWRLNIYKNELFLKRKQIQTQRYLLSGKV